jgi:hypothetical protein
MFADILDHRATRTALQKRAKPGLLVVGADGIDFDAAIAKIADKSGKLEPFGFVLSEIAKADALHHPGNKIAPRDLVRGHKSRNCNRGPEASAPPWRRECDRLKPFEARRAGGEVPRRRILESMEAHRLYGMVNALAKVAAAGALALCLNTPTRAQDTNGPLTPPPGEDHKVHRVTTKDPAAVPPALPPAEIIKAFAEKEDRYARARGGYTYRKTIKLTEYGKDGQPTGEYQVVTAATVDSDGRVYEKTAEKPQNSLQYLEILPGGGLASLAKMPSYPLVTGQLAKYNLRYVGDEKVDEIDCYIFEAKPKLLDRATALFQGVVWVDKQYLEVVKTYGKWVNDLGDVHPKEFPFVNFETYRENVDGKYWFPNYSRSDDFVHLKDDTIPVRLVIKWTDIKPLAANPAPPSAAPPPPASPDAAAKPQP